jgi:hypothetical protein
VRGVGGVSWRRQGWGGRWGIGGRVEQLEVLALGSSRISVGRSVQCPAWTTIAVDTTGGAVYGAMLNCSIDWTEEGGRLALECWVPLPRGPSLAGKGASLQGCCGSDSGAREAVTSTKAPRADIGSGHIKIAEGLEARQLQQHPSWSGHQAPNQPSAYDRAIE